MTCLRPAPPSRLSLNQNEATPGSSNKRNSISSKPPARKGNLFFYISYRFPSPNKFYGKLNTFLLTLRRRRTLGASCFIEPFAFYHLTVVNILVYEFNKDVCPKFYYFWKSLKFFQNCEFYGNIGNEELRQ